MNRTAALLCLILSIAVVASACDTDTQPKHDSVANSGPQLDGDFSGSGPGTLSSASTLPTVDRRLRAVTSVAARVEYTSTSGITDRPTHVTGTVFAPQGMAPDGGWPIIAFGHPTTGIEYGCAPSQSPTLLNISEVITLLVKAGYVVTMSDYQGLGDNTTYHPYLDPITAGYNLIDSARAARKLIPGASNRWLALGTSQGGQAAWAANELAATYGGGLALVGSVSLAPPLNLVPFADAAAGGQLSDEQKPALQLILATLQKEYPDFNLDDYRRGIVADKWQLLSSCDPQKSADRQEVVQQITNDDLLPSSPVALDALRAYLEKMSLPKWSTIAPMLVIYGGNDLYIPAAWTDLALDKACSMGDVIDIQLQTDKGHSDLGVTDAFPWITARFNDEPAINSCEAFIAARESAGPATGEGG